MITEIPLFHSIFQLTFCIFGCTMFAFDTILLLATVAAKKDQNIPFAYLIVMTICGIFGKLVYILDFTTYLVFPLKVYRSYRMVLGKEVTFLGTWSYYIIIFVSVLMTVNRLFVLIRPVNTRAFNRSRIFWYSGGIAVSCAIILLIPVFSTCPINFDAEKLEFASICGHNPHVLSKFVDDNSFAIVVILFLINSALVVYMRVSRGIQKISGTGKSSTIFTSSTSLLQRRREQTLTMQAIGVTFFLSIYEVGKFFNQNFLDTYNRIPVSITQAYFYFRFMSVLAINFFVYYAQSATGRKIVNRYLRIGKFSKNLVKKHVTSTSFY